MLIRNLQFFLRVCLYLRSAPFRPTVRGRDRTELPLDFLLTITPVRRLLITNCLLCRSGARVWYPIFGGPARNFRCIIYGRFNEPRKRSKGPRGLFLIIRRGQRRTGRVPCLLLLPFLFSLLFLFLCGLPARRPSFRSIMLYRPTLLELY